MKMCKYKILIWIWVNLFVRNINIVSCIMVELVFYMIKHLCDFSLTHLCHILLNLISYLDRYRQVLWKKIRSVVRKGKTRDNQARTKIEITSLNMLCATITIKAIWNRSDKINNRARIWNRLFAQKNRINIVH